MQARKIDLSPYTLDATDPKTGEPAVYKVRQTLLMLLFHPELKLDAIQVLEQNELAEKIRKEEADTILVSPEDYGKIWAAIQGGKGYSENDVRFIKRIKDAPEVTVDEQVSAPDK